jgi:homocysteine S-methyltransferase
MTRFTLAAAVALLSSATAMAAPASPWSTGQKTDEIAGNSSELNTGSLDGCPILSPDGRQLYMATPEYFDVFARRMIQAGARMVGGCCGTTPEHVRWMAKSARMLGGGSSPAVVVRPRQPSDRPLGVAPIELRDRSAFAKKLAEGKFVVSVEVNPAPGLDPKPALEVSKMLLENGVDIVNVADGPRAMARMANISFCSLLLRDYGIEPLVHVCGRDRNLLAQMAHLLGAHAMGIRNLVVITGDPPKVGDYPEATAVYDLDAVGLLQMASNMNRGIDSAAYFRQRAA